MTYIRPCRRDVPQALPLPIAGFQSSDRFTVATASQGLGAWPRNVNAAAGPSALAGTPNADLALRQLVVVEGHGQAQIIRFCANVTPRSNRIPECAFTDISVP